MVDADFNFKMPKIEMTDVSEDGKYGRFVVEPLERGYGLTLGNSLRRIMLSSLVGTAVSSVKIEGVLHEFNSRSKGRCDRNHHEHQAVSN